MFHIFSFIKRERKQKKKAGKKYVHRDLAKANGLRLDEWLPLLAYVRYDMVYFLLPCVRKRKTTVTRKIGGLEQGREKIARLKNRNNFYHLPAYSHAIRGWNEAPTYTYAKYDMVEGGWQRWRKCFRIFLRDFLNDGERTNRADMCDLRNVTNGHCWRIIWILMPVIFFLTSAQEWKWI